MTGVVAVVGGAVPPELGRQSVAVVDAMPGADAALARATTAGADWLWFIRPGSRPRIDALKRLLEGAHPTGEPSAALVAGLAVDQIGRPVEELVPAPDHLDPGKAIRLAEHRLLPIRHAPLANCLVERRALEYHGLPDPASFGPHAETVWTARILRGRPGYLAALSVVEVDQPHAPTPTASSAVETLRTARSGAWTRGETLQAVADLVRLARPRAWGR